MVVGGGWGGGGGGHTSINICQECLPCRAGFSKRKIAKGGGEK